MTKTVIKSPQQFIKWCKTLSSTFSIDTETTSLKYLDLELIGISIYDGKQACYIPLTVRNRQEILHILQFYIYEAKMIIFHNFSFDGMVFKKYGVEV